jgi:hypothetical protein
MTSRDTAASVGEWADATSSRDSERDREAAPAALGSPPASVGDAERQEVVTGASRPAPTDPTTDRGSRGGLGAGLGGSRDAGADAAGA